MATKVISAKLSSDDYDKLLDQCNSKGCTISEFVRDRCLEFLGTKPEDSMKKEQSAAAEPKQNEMDELKKKNFLLGFELSLAKDRIGKLDKRIDEFSELFSSQEISNRRICKGASNFDKKYCIKL